MIKINRPVGIPQKLLIEGAAADKINRSNYDQNPNSYISLQFEFEILNKIYGHDTVKSVLRTAQFGKCCFCEKDQKEEDGAVEHFRPKMGFKDQRKDKLTKPGYYWLGYTWSNLLFCCKKCNGAKCKGNLFPLRPKSKRARNHSDDLSLEDPFLIDPATIDPNDHIYFDEHLVGFRTDYGRESINVLKLDRPELNDLREEHLSNIKRAIIIVSAGKYFSPEVVDREKEFLIKAQLPTAKFSAATKAFISKSSAILGGLI